MWSRRQFLAGGARAGLGVLAGACGPGGPRDRGPYDVCVIGSGFAGLTLAQRVVDGGRTAVVLEAGTRPGAPDAGTAEAFDFVNAGASPYPVNRSRVIALGGTSHHWTGSVNRLRPTDFRVRSEFGMDVDWPLTYAELAPWYCEAERILAATGDPVVEGAEPPRECTYPFRLDERYEMPDVSFRRRPVPFFAVPRSRRQGDGEAVRLGAVELPRFESRPGAELLAARPVTELVTTDGPRVDHARVRLADGSEERVFARTFVVAAGVFESPSLLLRSRSQGFPDGLGNGRDLVGRFLAAHPSYIWSIHSPAQPGLTQGIHRTYAFNDDFRSRGLNACHFQLHIDGSEWVNWKAQPEMEPRPENRVRLSASRRNGLGLPLMEVHFGLSPRDLRTVEESMPFLRTQVRALGVGRHRLERGMRWRYHPSGTCRMAADESAGVVDRDQRVFGVENLYVSGASVFPTAGTSNPTLSVVALSLRLGDHLLTRL